MVAALRRGARDRPRGGRRCRLGVGGGAAPHPARHRRPLPGRLADRRGARLRRSPTRSAARGSSPSTSPGSRSAARAIPAKRTITTFHQGLAWVAQVALFLVLGLLVFPSELGDVWRSRARSLALIVAARRPPDRRLRSLPAFFPYSDSERVVLSWAGLRGAVPVVLATFPVIAGVAAERDLLRHRLLRRALCRRSCRARPSSTSRAACGRPRASPRFRSRSPRPA